MSINKETQKYYNFLTKNELKETEFGYENNNTPMSPERFHEYNCIHEFTYKFGKNYEEYLSKFTKSIYNSSKH